MLDKNDLQLIQEMMDRQEKRILEQSDVKLEAMEKRILEQSAANMRVILESYVEPKFNLLAESIQDIQEKLIPRSRVDDLEDEVKFLKSVVRQINEEVQTLKKAQ